MQWGILGDHSEEEESKRSTYEGGAFHDQVAEEIVVLRPSASRTACDSTRIICRSKLLL